MRIRSTRTAHAYVGRKAAELTDGEGFVDTGDMVELRGDSYHFVGRRGGIINIGGLKVHPEEIEAVINRHAGGADVARQIAPQPDHRRALWSPTSFWPKASTPAAATKSAPGFWPIARRRWRRTRCPP